MMTSGPPQKTSNKILLENEVFTPGNSKSNELPCRMVWDLVIYDSKVSLILGYDRYLIKYIHRTL